MEFPFAAITVAPAAISTVAAPAAPSVNAIAPPIKAPLIAPPPAKNIPKIAAIAAAFPTILPSSKAALSYPPLSIRKSSSTEAGSNAP